MIKENEYDPIIDEQDWAHLLGVLKLEEEFDFTSPFWMIDSLAKSDACLKIITRMVTLKNYQSMFPDAPRTQNWKTNDLSTVKLTPLTKLLKREFSWTQNAFSNGCGRLDISADGPTITPHRSFLKNLFNSPSGSSFHLTKHLIPHRTVIKFRPEKLVSTSHSRDVNFWLSHFKNEAVYCGPMNEGWDIFGLPKDFPLDKKNSDLLNKNLIFMGFSRNNNSTELYLGDNTSNELWILPSIVFFGCAGIELGEA